MLVVFRKLLVVEKVMRHIVACVSKDAATVRSQSRMPIPKDDSMSKLPERCCQNDEKRRRHNKPVFVHGQVVVDAVEEEVEGNTDTIVGQMVIQME
ncbi:hypothetical protein A7L03_19200 [Acinetobacter baumannii]|nr:hypothetical protein A7L03_19200 [Acinetobacter baumannii]